MSSSDSRAKLAVRALRHRNFQLFFAGQLISLVGTWMQTVAQSWLIYRLTGSSVLLGLVNVASQVPVFLLAPFGGTVADRGSRRRILVITQCVSMLLAFVLAALTLSGRIHEWHIFVLASLLGVVNAFDIPARQSFVVEMVGREDLMNAIALNSSMFNGARIIGPAIAGIFVGAFGEGWCFFANAASYIAVIIGLLLMRLTRADEAPRQRKSPFREIAEGFRFVVQTPPIRALLLLLAVIGFLGMPYAVLMPIFADKILHAGASGLGILMGGSGLGALLSSIFLASRPSLKGLGAWIAGSTIVFGAALGAFAYSRLFWLSVVLLVPVGFAMMLELGGSNTLIQAMVPNAIRGRVMAIYSMIFMGMAPLGALLGGMLAEHIGPSLTVASGGAGCVIAGLLFARVLPDLRPAARELILQSNAAVQDFTAAVGATSPAMERTLETATRD
jgi:MFS family permease